LFPSLTTLFDTIILATPARVFVLSPGTPGAKVHLAEMAAFLYRRRSKAGRRDDPTRDADDDAKTYARRRRKPRTLMLQQLESPRSHRSS
jgi:hypothetical protein